MQLVEYSQILYYKHLIRTYKYLDIPIKYLFYHMVIKQIIGLGSYGIDGSSGITISKFHMKIYHSDKINYIKINNYNNPVLRIETILRGTRLFKKIGII